MYFLINDNNLIKDLTKMNYREHSLIGIISIFIFIPLMSLFIGISVHFSSEEFYTILILVILGSVAPDIDHPNSKISNYVQSMLLSFSILFLIIDFVFFNNKILWHDFYYITLIFPIASIVFTTLLYEVFGHRTITHSVLAILIIMTVGFSLIFAKIITPVMLFSFTWGYVLHLYYDGRTEMGVAYLYPFSKEFYGTFIRNNQKQKNVELTGMLDLTIMIITILSIIYFFKNNYEFINL